MHAHLWLCLKDNSFFCIHDELLPLSLSPSPSLPPSLHFLTALQVQNPRKENSGTTIPESQLVIYWPTYTYSPTAEGLRDYFLIPVNLLSPRAECIQYNATPPDLSVSLIYLFLCKIITYLPFPSFPPSLPPPLSLPPLSLSLSPPSLSLFPLQPLLHQIKPLHRNFSFINFGTGNIPDQPPPSCVEGGVDTCGVIYCSIANLSPLSAVRIDIQGILWVSGCTSVVFMFRSFLLSLHHSLPPSLPPSLPLSLRLSPPSFFFLHRVQVSEKKRTSQLMPGWKVAPHL